ncbi:radical SAM family heme chaperone HemW [Desulfovibrio sp. Fe33]|uniref:radical SAM family heme chaperone HemW n=1 Tax=Desulfovibrio sp. Fe33 TaxID=3020842 RepID=UPI00234DDFB8|nr:radical SAM family heme chaperone HemW [Desulfovibrio sp. Fe33]
MGRIHDKNTPTRPAFPGTGPAPTRSATDRKGLLLYIHVPFCRSRCHYCSFHSQVFEQTTFAWYLSLLLKEIELWGRRLQRPALRTIYFGGGTPSMVPLAGLDRIMEALDKAFIVNPGIETTIEANPDSAHDVSYFRGLLNMGFNRLSLGVQSLRDADLQMLGRPHSAGMAHQAFDQARRAGFGNIGLDLIWGLPGQKLKAWLDALKVVSEMRPEHISAYNLTLEDGTVTARRCGPGGDLILPPDQEQGRMFVYGAEFLESVGYLHYEVSNFARMGFMSVHNSGYWNGSDYLGLGPSAVSTLGRRRFTVPRYMDEYDAYVRGELVGNDFEELTDDDLLTELVMLSLRTSRGLDLKEYRKRTGFDLVKKQERLISTLHRENLVRISGGRLRLTKNGMLVSNAIIKQLAFGD